MLVVQVRSSVMCKGDPYRKGDTILYKQAKYTLEKEIRAAKSNYSGKLRIQFSSSDSASVWKESERDNQLQDTIPQHCGESTTGRRFE